MSPALRGMLAAMALAGALVLCAAHDRPTVGILTQRYDATQSYIAASYVKFVEGAGARAVPLHYDRWDAATLQKVLASVNGVLLPGGGAEFAGAYWDALQTIFTYATRANANGIHYPIWGTCLGVCCCCCSCFTLAQFSSFTGLVRNSLRSCWCSARTTRRCWTRALTAATSRCRSCCRRPRSAAGSSRRCPSTSGTS